MPPVMRPGILRKTPAQIEAMREAGRIVAHVLEAVAAAVQPGVSTLALDTLAETLIREAGAIPSFKGYEGYPATLCTSINDEVVHGIPDASRILADGDLLKIDCGANLHGWHGDAAVTVIAGSGTPAAQRLLTATREALAWGIRAAQPGGHLGDIGAAIEVYALTRGYEVVRECAGHGIGQHLHEPPVVHNYGERGKGPRLEPGMTLCLEPMLTLGGWKLETLPDGWTARTEDRSLAAHFEHMIAITRDGPVILTTP